MQVLGNEMRLIGLLIFVIAGCTSGDEPSSLQSTNPDHQIAATATHHSSVVEQPVANRETNPIDQTAIQPEKTVAIEGEKQYDGHTLIEWRQRIKDLDPNDPAAAKAVPGLIEIVADKNAPWFSRRQAALTLGRIGPAAKQSVPLLIDLLDERRDDENTTSLWAAKALALFGPAAKDAAPALIRRLKDKSAQPTERQVTLDALSRIGTADPAVLPALIAIVSSADEDLELRTLTAESLAYLGPRAAVAVPALLRVTESKNEPLRRAAVTAIAAVGPMADVAVPTLAELLVFDESAAVRDQAADALSQIGSPSADLLIRLAGDEDVEVRWRAVRSLGRIRPPVKATVPTLSKALQDDDANVRMHAMEALWVLQPDTEKLILALLSEFTNRDRQIRIRAFKLLISMGKKAQPAIARLQELTEDERPYVQQTARKALNELQGSESPEPAEDGSSF